MLRSLFGPSAEVFGHCVRPEGLAELKVAKVLKPEVWMTDTALEQLAKGQLKRLGDTPWDRSWLP